MSVRTAGCSRSQAAHTDVAHCMIAASLSLPGTARSTSATVTLPLCTGESNEAPLLRLIGESHMRPLDSFPSVTTFEKETETNQGECDGDRLRGGTGVLGCVSIHRNLMDEERITVRQSVEPEFVAQALAFGGGVHLRI